MDRSIETKQKTGTAVILCGGKSTRAGMDKQLLIVNGMKIAVYIAEKLKAELDEIILVTNKTYLYADTPYKVVEDIYKDFGPLGGIHSGLYHSKSDMVYVTACDMPNVCLPFIKWMKSRLNELNYNIDVIAVKTDSGYTEPFNGFYSTNSILAINKAVLRGDRKITSIYKDLKTYYIKEEEIQNFKPYDMFFNMNRPQEITAFMARTKLEYKRTE